MPVTLPVKTEIADEEEMTAEITSEGAAASSSLLVMDPLGVETAPQLPQHFSVATDAASSSGGGNSPPHREEGAPVKRAKTVPSYKEMPELSLWNIKMKGKNNYNNPNISIFCPTGIPRFALYTSNEERQRLPFGLDLEPQNNPPSFLSGLPDPNKASESLDLLLSLTKSQEEYIEEIEKWVRSEAVKNSKDWWNRQYSETEINNMFSSALKRDADGKYQTKLRAKFVLSGRESFLTKVVFFKADRSTRLFGAGWDFVKPLLGPKAWRRCEARANVEVRSIWIVGKKFGVKFCYSDLLIMEEAVETSSAGFPELDD